MWLLENQSLELRKITDLYNTINTFCPSTDFLGTPKDTVSFSDWSGAQNIVQRNQQQLINSFSYCRFTAHYCVSRIIDKIIFPSRVWYLYPQWLWPATYSQLLLQPSVKLLSWLYAHMASPPSVRPFTGMSNSTRIIFGNLTCKFLTTQILLSFASFFCFPGAIMPVIILDFNMFRCSRLRSCLKCLKF